MGQDFLLIIKGSINLFYNYLPLKLGNHLGVILGVIRNDGQRMGWWTSVSLTAHCAAQVLWNHQVLWASEVQASLGQSVLQKLRLVRNSIRSIQG